MEVEQLAEAAWQATKDDADSDWANTPLAHRERFIYVAQSVVQSGVADTPFEKKVAELLKTPPKVKAAAADMQVEVPVEPTVKHGKLPDNFPARAALESEGINTYAQLRKVKDLTTIPGIGPATAEKITEALGDTETVH